MSLLKRVLIKLIIGLLAVCILYTFPKTVSAFVMDYDIKSVYYYTFDDSGDMSLESVELYFCGDIENEQKAFILFHTLFENKEYEIAFIPLDTQLIDVKIYDETVFINVSKEILNFGGSASEIALVNQIIKTASGIDGVNYVTLLIDNELLFLPEGTKINKYQLSVEKDYTN